MAARSDLVLWFKDVDKDDVPIVGGKGANLGEMTRAGFPVPNGFITTSEAYYQYIKENNLTTKIKHLISTANFDKPESLLQVSEHIKKEMMRGEVNEEFQRQVFAYYRQLGHSLKDVRVAVRSSATAEDLPQASFAGQQETFLNVKGEANLMQKIKAAWASLFEARAMFYRHEQKFDHFRVGIAVVVQAMIESEKSGIMFTLDPVTNDKSKIIIEAIFGLGEYIVSGKVTPDHYEVHKTDHDILKRTVSTQDVLLERSSGKNKERKLSISEGKKQKVSDTEILGLADLGRRLEKHYYFPQDIEWAIQNKHFYIVQARPITTIHTKEHKDDDTPSAKLPLLLQGSPASPGIASGPVRILRSVHDMSSLLPGDILVTSQTNPDFTPAMKKAAAIITEKGGRTSHAAIVARELGTPAVVGTEHALTTLKNGMVVTVNGSKGEIYKGATFLSSTNKDQSENSHIKTATKVYVNVAEPEFAASIASKNVDGVGLLRAEFMMAGIGVHPKKVIRDGKKHEFVEKLASQLEIFCEAFNPRPVVYRASDFKTNEYRGLLGGKEYEPVEANPMLGYRGAFRYIHDPEVFELELEAIKIVRQKKNLKNLWLMVPFVRTVRELVEVKKLINNAGLQRSPLFRLWMMVEVPSTVVMLEEFIKVGIDGVSIGSNDLTMLMLGTDRDNSEIARTYDEQNPAVLWAIEHVIKTARKNHISSSICGQAPSLYPELLEKLVSWGITSVSVAPDVIDSVRKHIAKVERTILK